MTAKHSSGQRFLVNQLLRQTLKNFFRFKGDKSNDAKKRNQEIMKCTSKQNLLNLLRMSGMTAILTLGACSAAPERTPRPAALDEIKPSQGPVAHASINAPARMESRPAYARPMANLPKPLLAEIVTPKRRLQCVPYARQLSNIQIRGNAWTWWEKAVGRYVRSGAPKAGSVLVLKRKNNANSLGHVAYVEEIIDNRMIVVSHANWLNKGRLHNHTPVLDVSKANDWSEVRFWHTPGRHFGGHVYRPYGFILPNQTFASR